MAVDNESLLTEHDSILDNTKDQYLTFEIDNEDYGIEIAYVKEIMKMKAITKVPDMPPYIEGIISLRGELIGVLDVRKRFRKMPKEHDESTCIIVIEYGENILGLVVDGVKEVMTIEAANVILPPSAKLNYRNQYIRNIGKVGSSVRLLLDLERFLAQD